MVFDGKPPKAKDNTILDRATLKQENKDKINALETEIDSLLIQIQQLSSITAMGKGDVPVLVPAPVCTVLVPVPAPVPVLVPVLVPVPAPVPVLVPVPAPVPAPVPVLHSNAIMTTTNDDPPIDDTIQNITIQSLIETITQKQTELEKYV